MIVFRTDHIGNVIGIEVTFDRPLTRDDLPQDETERRDFVINRAKIELDKLRDGQLGEYGSY